jgi:hypothetical protein
MTPPDDERDVIPEALRRLVIARLNLIPSDVKMSVGSAGEFTRDELIRHVEVGDDVGRAVAESQRRFLHALGQGVFLDELLPEPPSP